MSTYFLFLLGPEEFNMVVVEVGYVLRTWTAEERFASSKDVAYDIEILKVSVNYS